MSAQPRVAVVTGAGSGIGRAVAVELATCGHAVVVSDVDEPGVKDTAREVEAKGAHAVCVRADVSDEGDVEALFGEVATTFGRLDAAVNCAGVTGPVGAPHEFGLEEWNRVLAVNLTGVFLCARREIAAMLGSGGGAIVNIASAAGLIGFPGLPAYSPSKAGVIGLTRAWALDYAKRGVRINCVCPGGVDTPMIRSFVGGSQEALDAIAASQPIGRLASPEEIAKAALWLCSDDASNVIGHAMAVDGGVVIS